MIMPETQNLNPGYLSFLSLSLSIYPHFAVLLFNWQFALGRMGNKHLNRPWIMALHPIDR